MALGYVQAKYEITVGNQTVTPTYGTKVVYFPLIDFTPAVKPSVMMRDDELRNIDEPLAVVADAYDPSWSMTVRAYPDTLGFLLKAMLGAPVTTAGDGIIVDPSAVAVPIGAYRHVWTAPFGPTGLNPQTCLFTVSYKQAGIYYTMAGSGVTSLDISSPEKGGVTVKVSGGSTYMLRLSDPALSPAYEALSIGPFVRGNLTLPTWLSSTAVTQDFTVNIANAQDYVHTLGSGSSYPDDVEKGDAPIIVSGTMPKRVINSTDYDAMLNVTGFATLAKWTNKTFITGSYPYQMWVATANTQYTDGGPDALMNKRRIGGSFNWKATNSAGTAGSSTITLCNATTSYV